MYIYNKLRCKFVEVQTDFNTFTRYDKDSSNIPDSVDAPFKEIAGAFDTWVALHHSAIAFFDAAYLKDPEYGCYQLGFKLTRKHTTQYIVFFGYTALVTGTNDSRNDDFFPRWVLDNVSIETVSERKVTPVDNRSAKYWKRRSAVTLVVEHNTQTPTLCDKLTEQIFDTIEYENVLISDNAVGESTKS